MSTGTETRDPLAVLEEMRQREQAATRGPWEAEEDGDCWQLFGAVRPGMHSLQLAKAPKHGTPYAEHWPNEADSAFITAARSDLPLLLKLLDAGLKPHEPIQIYKSADDCGHECPPEPDWHASPDKAASGAWDAYQDEHTTGSGPDGGTGEGVRICLLSPDYMACPACSKLVYGTWGDEERFISAAECTVRPLVIAAALSPEETPAS